MRKTVTVKTVNPLHNTVNIVAGVGQAEKDKVAVRQNFGWENSMMQLPKHGASFHQAVTYCL